ncbi:sugar ABC transporter permease [Cellulomonas sp. HD19AZ1]|jgi:ABC-type sugar transport system permease subunit|nr:sugar ABC transporter permease [Cellulomonas sp. HD19AZ1]
MMTMSLTTPPTAPPPSRAPRPPAAVPATRRRSLRSSRLPLALLAPAVALVALVSVFPILFALNLSVHETRYTQVGDLVGLQHYLSVLATAQGWAMIGRSMVYVVGSLVLALPLAVGLAHLLDRPARLRRVFRVLILMPWVISQTVAALLWRWLLNPDYGPLGLGSLGGQRVDVLADPVLAMVALVLVNVWLSYPLATILVLAALQGVPAELHEAAEVDGATAFRRFRSVTLPMIAPTVFVVAIMLTLLYFNMVTLVLTFTGGGPFSATQLVSLEAYQQSFSYFNLGLGAAYSVILFVFNVVFGLAYIRMLRGDRDV